MSLGVKLDHVRGPAPPGERLVRVTFRGVSRVSRIFLHTGDYAVINQLLEYPIARAINGDEKVDIQILVHNKFLSNRVISSVSFSLHRLLDEACVQLAASLLDSSDKPTKAVLHLTVWYTGPGQHDNLQGLEQDHHLEEDTQALINLERNIANLERSMSASQLGKSDLTSLLNNKDQTDRDTEDETGLESQEETDRGRWRGRRESLGSCISDNGSAKSIMGKRKPKKSNK